MSQEIIFTTLPHKQIVIDGKKHLRLSVYTSIKLGTNSDTNLNSFPDILNWSEKMLSSDFKFILSNGKKVSAKLEKGEIDDALFKNIFHKNIKVDDFKEEDLSKKKFYSVPLVHIQDFVLKNVKLAAIESPKKLLSAEKFIDKSNLGAISRFQLKETKIAQTENQIQKKSLKKPIAKKDIINKKLNTDKELKLKIQQDKFIKFNTKMRPVKDFTELRQFHRVDRKFANRPNFKIVRPSFEFHDIMAVINSYPQIMRKMGFILDFVIPYENDFPGTGHIRIMPEALDLDENKSVISVPATAYEITEKGFYIADRANTMFKKGFVKINSNEFSVVQVDADGAALKISNMAENKVQEIAKFYEDRAVLAVGKKTEDGLATPPEDAGLPYMRTSGIAITKNGMAEYIFKSIKLNTDLKIAFKNTTTKTVSVKKGMLVAKPPMLNLKIKEPEKVLYSDEVTQGYRMDIAYHDNPDKWYSLHMKKDTFSWYDEAHNAHPIDNIHVDEGFIQLGVAEDPEDKDDVFVSETLARWEGWSLSVHKPGFAINEAEDSESNQGVKKDFVHKSKTLENKKYTFDPDLEFKINANSGIVPETLPKLRFGKDYDVRIRTVDLAGNSVGLNFKSETPNLTSRTNIRYMRYEPLASPIILVGNELKDGEFLENMVIRSNFDQTTTEYEDSHPVNNQFFDEFSERHLLPPKNSQLMAETHGMFEKAFTNNPAAAQKIYEIITQHEGIYERPDKTKEKVYKASEVEVIYLPDPMAAGVALFLADGFNATHTQQFNAQMFSFFSNNKITDANQVTIPEDWYNAQAIHIRLEEGPIGSKWNVTNRTITISLPKGQRTMLKFSTFWRREDMENLSALFDLVKKSNPKNLNEFTKLAKNGQQWMISPSKNLELVHAVQQPVDKPKIKAILPERSFNDTTVNIHTRFDIHGESTEKVAFHARWVDPIDDGISVVIKDKEASNSIDDIIIHYHDDIITKGTIPEQSKVVNANLRQLELKPKIELIKPTKTQFKANPQPGAKKINTIYKPKLKQFESYKKVKATPKITMVERLKYDLMEPEFKLVKDIDLRMLPLVHHFGDTKHRWVDYKLVASSRYREYFDKILEADESLKSYRESIWIKKVNILSSTRPNPPEIDYIIPTFEWKKTKNSSKIIHERLGGGLRIYIKRPWFSSGVDEKLAVLIPPTNSDSFTIAGRGKINTPEMFTRWAIDPILYANKPNTNSPTKNDFRFSPEVDESLSYPENKLSQATAVAYPVHFDSQRQLWYADIAISPKQMYFPFIKLVVARYQKHSVRSKDKDVCLSTPVTSDFIQLMPDRKTSLTFKGNKASFKLDIEGNIFNVSNTPYGNYNFVRISFLDSLTSKPITEIIYPKSRKSILDRNEMVIGINRNFIRNNKYYISKEFRLPSDYGTKAFDIVIEEYERGPDTMDILSEYKDRLVQSEETDRLIYADVIKVNQ